MREVNDVNPSTSKGDFEAAIEDEAEKTWHKVTGEWKNHGFRDGISEGRESMFQKSFDEGYAHGFCNGFSLGKLKGHLKALHEHDKSHISHQEEFLEHTRKGLCKICVDKSLLDKTNDEITSQQKKAMDITLEILHSKYQIEK